MENLTAQQFKSRYGEQAVSNFDKINETRFPQEISKTKEFGKGVLKGAAESAFETANLITEGGRYIQAGITPGVTVGDLQNRAKESGDTKPWWVQPFAGKNEEDTRKALESKNPYQTAGKVTEFAAEVVSPLAIMKAGVVLRKAAPTVNKLRSTMKFSAKKTDDVMPTAKVTNLLNKYRLQLSDIDPRYETVLKKQKNNEKVLQYFDQAEKAATNLEEPMATSLASKEALRAYDAIGKGMEDAGKMKSELLTSIEDVKMPGNIPGRSIDNVKSVIKDRFGVEIDQAGNVYESTGRVASIDSKSQKLISEYVGMLRELGPNPTARKLDDFVDATQRMLYKQSSPNLYEVADEPVIAFLKSETGNINNQLKSTVDGVLEAKGLPAEYAALNTKYSELIEIQNNLNKRLGTEGDKGASLMKSLFSPQTGEPTRRLFAQINEETGIDLFQEAALAKFAMESVGDPRSKSLLQQLDLLTGDVSKLDLTKPGSWVNFIRERADFDGKELAEQVIKQSSDEVKP